MKRPQSQSGILNNSSMHYRQVKRDTKKKAGPTLNSTVLSSAQIPIRSKKQQVDFIESNKKNLRNFFKDRIQKQKLSIQEKQIHFSPSKILEYRKQQDQKQSKTNISLKNSMQFDGSLSKGELKRMNTTFVMDDKNVERTNKINKGYNGNRTCLNKTYQSATTNSIKKRCQTAKKRAYISVFGDDCRGQTLFFPPNPETQMKKFKLSNFKKKSQTQEVDKQKFRNLLDKIEKFAEGLNPHHAEIFQQKKNSQKLSRQTTQDERLETAVLKSEMVSHIQKISSGYKHKIEEFESNKAQQSNEKQIGFFTQLKKHKDTRLRIRNQALTSVSLNNQNQMQVEQMWNFQPAPITKVPLQKAFPQNSENNLEAMLTITDRMLDTVEEKQFNSDQDTKQRWGLSLKEKLVIFSKKMVQTIHNSKLYCIPHYKMYTVLWKPRNPFELEGSYAFFKLVKAGNIPMIQNFIKQNQDFAYQIDAEGRTVLAYAVQNNQTEVVRFFVKLGLHIDRKSKNGKSPLYYAIKNNNPEIVMELLRMGACPWSTPNCSLASLLEVACPGVKMLIKNARRLHLGGQLCRKFTDKIKLWEKHRSLINDQELFEFN